MDNHTVSMSPLQATPSGSRGTMARAWGASVKRFGIDVNRTITEQLAGADQRLLCTHEAADEDDWREFCAAVLAYHAIDVPFDTIRV